jgi:alkylhydroperoxidase/carboxymuconolactone decarboxylase family protein YurZ
MQTERLEESFVNLKNSVNADGILDPKTEIMILLGAAMALACYPCMKSLTKVAKERNVSEEEIETVHGLVMAVGAGRVFYQYREACSGME